MVPSFEMEAQQKTHGVMGWCDHSQQSPLGLGELPLEMLVKSLGEFSTQIWPGTIPVLGIVLNLPRCLAVRHHDLHRLMLDG